MSDIMRGIRPFSFVFIGEETAIITNYNLTINNRGESGTANIQIPLENIASEVFAEDSINENIHEVEIWSGYLEDIKDPIKQAAELKRKIDEGINPVLLSKRFDGYVSQPEWSIGTGGKFLHLSCLDWTSFLRESKYDKNFEDGATEIRNIVATLQKLVHGLTIKLESYSGSKKLGETDEESKKQVYNATGKTFYDILDDCAKQLGYVIIPEGKTIHLTPNKRDPLIWNMYYGPITAQEINGESVGQYFEDLQFRYSAKGRIDKSEIVIECLGTNHLKSGTNKRVRVMFPDDIPLTPKVKHIKIVVPGSSTETRCRVIAENTYKNLSKRMMTGTLSLPFANQYILPWDIMEFVIHKSEEELQFINGYWVEVSSISETFSSEGNGNFSQVIDWELNNDLKNTITRKIAPKHKGK